MVARVMELVNATRKAIDSGCGPADPAVREAAEAVAVLLSLVAPYTPEEMWARPGGGRVCLPGAPLTPPGRWGPGWVPSRRSRGPAGRLSTRRYWSSRRSP